MTNENVCVSGFQRFGFEPEPGSEPEEVERILKKSRADFVVIDDPLRTGSEPAERARPAAARAWFVACDLNPWPEMRWVMARGCGKSLCIISLQEEKKGEQNEIN